MDGAPRAVADAGACGRGRGLNSPGVCVITGSTNLSLGCRDETDSPDIGDGQKGSHQLLVRDRRGSRDAVDSEPVSAKHRAHADPLQPLSNPAQPRQGRRGRDRPQLHYRLAEETRIRRAQGLCHHAGGARPRAEPRQARRHLQRHRRKPLYPRPAVVGLAGDHLCRDLDVRDPPHGSRRARRRHADRQEPRQNLCREGDQGHLCRCRRGRRGQGGARRNRQFPEGPQGLRTPRRASAERGLAGRPAGHRQDLARPRRRRRGRGPVFFDFRLGICRDVCRRRRRPGARPVRPGPPARAGDHLYRRTRRARPGPRPVRRRRPGRKGPDPEPAFGRARRLRPDERSGFARRHQPARGARPGLAARRAL